MNYRVYYQRVGSTLRSDRRVKTEKEAVRWFRRYVDDDYGTVTIDKRHERGYWTTVRKFERVEFVVYLDCLGKTLDQL